MTPFSALLTEIDARSLYLRRGYSSLFDHAVRELGYSDAAAGRRIAAMRLCAKHAGTRERLRDGSLSLSAAAELQWAFDRQHRGGQAYFDGEAARRPETRQRFDGEGCGTAHRRYRLAPQGRGCRRPAGAAGRFVDADPSHCDGEAARRGARHDDCAALATVLAGALCTNPRHTMRRSCTPCRMER